MSLSHTFELTGTYTVAIAVQNCDMSTLVTDTVQVTVVPRPYLIHLPLLLREYTRP